MKRISQKVAVCGVAIVFLGLCGLLTQPHWIFRLAVWLKPGALYAVQPPAVSASEYEAYERKRIVALTIDDGPSAATADILATIDRYQAKATFFNISSSLPGREEIVRQTVASGHELGNHLSADEPSIRMSPQEFEADLQVAQTALLALLPEGSALRWLRPGMGFYNAPMVATAEENGYQLVLGSNFPYDTHVPSPRFASAFIVNTVQPGDIIVLHDGEERGERTVATLEKVLPALHKKGYTITTVSELVDISKQAAERVK